MQYELHTMFDMLQSGNSGCQGAMEVSRHLHSLEEQRNDHDTKQHIFQIELLTGSTIKAKTF